jgi:hypothetical protein
MDTIWMKKSWKKLRYDFDFIIIIVWERMRIILNNAIGFNGYNIGIERGVCI